MDLLTTILDFADAWRAHDPGEAGALQRWRDEQLKGGQKLSGGNIRRRLDRDDLVERFESLLRIPRPAGYPRSQRQVAGMLVDEDLADDAKLPPDEKKKLGEQDRETLINSKVRRYQRGRLARDRRLAKK